MNWLIGVSSAVALLVVVACAFILRLRLELRKLSPLPSGRILDNVYAVRDGHMNFYLIQRGDRYIAIDAGQNLSGVERELIRMNIDKNKVIAVFLTHTDRDHAGALRLFGEAKVYISGPEEALLNGKTHRFFIFGNKIAGPYEKIEDDVEMRFGDISIRSILTPGHTPGSTCYLVNEGLLFTGDSLSLKSGRVDVFNPFFNMDTATQKKSLNRIAILQGVKCLFTAHYGFTDDFRKAFEKWNR